MQTIGLGAVRIWSTSRSGRGRSGIAGSSRSAIDSGSAVCCWSAGGSAQQTRAILYNGSASAASAGIGRIHNLRSLLRRVAKLRRHSLAHTASATGCNDEVCININGSGLHMNYWQVIAFMPNGDCTFGNYFSFGRYVFSTPRRYGSGSTTLTGPRSSVHLE
jgi:hypothetical protein